MLPQWVLADPQLYEIEKEKVFGHTWQFLGHESEIEEPGVCVSDGWHMIQYW